MPMGDRCCADAEEGFNRAKIRRTSIKVASIGRQHPTGTVVIFSALLQVEEWRSVSLKGCALHIQ
jgi:hypothetical protein